MGHGRVLEQEGDDLVDALRGGRQAAEVGQELHSRLRVLYKVSSLASSAKKSSRLVLLLPRKRPSCVLPLTPGTGSDKAMEGPAPA